MAPHFGLVWWVLLTAGLVALLLVDLLVLHRDPHAISMRDAAWSTAGFVAISVVFGTALGLVEGRDAAGQFFAGYVLETSDVIFAVDSIPAIFGVTRQPFLVFSATALALLGMRSMYFLLAGARGRFVYLDLGLAVILLFVGAKFVLESVTHVPVGVSLLVIVGVIAATIAASLLRDRTGDAS